MKNTRRSIITRSKMVEDKKHPGQMKKIYVDYVIHINSAVTDSHRMVEKW